MQALVALAVRRRVSVLMAALAAAAFGFVGYSRLSLELFPDVAYPSLTVQTEFPDTAPQEVENLVTRPVEEAVGVLRGLQRIRSVSRSGVSEVTLEFDWDSDMDMLSMDVREKLDRLILPDEAESPIVLRFDPALDPIMRLALSGPQDLTALRTLADRRIKPEFETLRGVASAQIKGGYEQEVQIDVDQERLAALGIGLDRVEQVVAVSNVNLPGGALRGAENQYLIRTLNEFRSVEEIGALIVQQTPAPVRLRDVAEVRLGAKEREEITRVDGRECIEIALYKEGDANTVAVADAIQKRLAEWRDQLPPEHTLDVLFDQSRFIQQSIAEVRNAALIGGVLAIIVLFLFLRDIRSTLIIATSIPLSVIITFMLMYRLDISLNIMSLGGLTLGIGMLVDNSIVVLESIFRQRKAGYDLVRAAVFGTTEVGPAVIASTLTTVAVFLPIVFIEGIAGQLFADQALTVTISLLASLLVAVTMIPMLSALGGKLPRPSERLERLPATAGLVADDEGWILGAFSRTYDRLLRGAIARRGLTLATAAGLLVLAVVGLRTVGSELIPSLSEGEFFYEVKMPEGTSLAATDVVVDEMERTALDQQGVGLVYSTVGSRLVSGGVSLNTRAENLAQVNVVVDEPGARDEDRIAEALRQRFQAIPDVELKLGHPDYFTLKTPVEVILYGENLDVLRGTSLDVAEALREVPGLVDVRSSLEAGNPELQVVFDRTKLASLGLDMADLSETLRNRVQGVIPTRYKQGDQQIDVRIRNRESDRSSFGDVRNLIIPGPDGEPIRLLTVADVRLARGPAEIHRLQQQRAAVVTANLKGRTLGAVAGDIRAALDDVGTAPGVSAELGGQNEEMRVSFASLRFAIALAVFLVYLVMASTFESFLHPFLVMFSIPLAVVGVAAALLLTRTPISVIVLIGVIMLVGIVVNNAIVLIDAVNRLRRDGARKVDAVRAACHLRLRPILMTTLTTILGLLPMAVGWGEGAELRAPLAVTVIGGLLMSTLLTLVVIPAAYLSVPDAIDPDRHAATDAEAGAAGMTAVPVEVRP